LIEHARRLNPNLPGFELWTLGEAFLDAGDTKMQSKRG
jgi:hypothetical protein